MGQGDWKTAYADVDIRYGALFVRDYGSYAEVVEVTDLDGATGTTGMVLVESGDVSIEYAGDFAAQRQRFASAITSSGPGSLKGLSHEAGRLVGYAALWSYGYRDIESSHVLAERDVPQKQDGWEAEDYADDADEIWGFLADEYGIERQ